MAVSDFCTAAPRSLPRDTPVEAALHLLHAGEPEPLVVVDEQGAALGLLGAAEVVGGVLQTGRDPAAVAVGEVMRHDFESARDDEEVAPVLRRMRAAGTRVALVLDGEGRPVGVLHFAELLRVLAQALGGGGDA